MQEVSSSSDVEPVPGVARRYLGLALLVVTGLVLWWWSWGTWPDVVIDFGRELYLPWQLCEGQVLYRDLAHISGPLSPYINALCFQLFGTSLLTLVVCNALVLALLVGLMYRVLRQVGDRLAVTAACLIFLLVFAFGQQVAVGNYNFICPYAHELTHGLTLSLAALHGLVRYQRGRHLRWVAVMGFAVGLSCLTKLEVFVAAAGAVTTGLVLTLWMQRCSGREALKALAVYLPAMAAPIAGAIGLLACALPLSQACEGVLGAWQWGLTSDAALALDFYRWGMGIDAPGANLASMATWAAAYVLIFAVIAWLSLRAGRTSHGKLLPAVAGSLLAGGILLWGVDYVRWDDVARPLPLILVVLVGIGAIRLASEQEEDRGRAVVLVALSLFALLLLGKMILRARLYHYGFALAAPGTILAVVALVGWIPAWIERRHGNGQVFRAVALAVLVVGAGVHVQRSRDWFAVKSIRVGLGADTFLADPRGDAVSKALTQIKAQTDPKQTLVVMPEGVMLNYLARRNNPTPYINFMPLELNVFGEQRMLAALQARPPDMIALVHKDTSEYGPRFFGRDYGQAIGAWVRAEYEPTTLIGAAPLQDDRFGILLLRRRVD